jgi:hypothetical protein
MKFMKKLTIPIIAVIAALIAISSIILYNNRGEDINPPQEVFETKEEAVYSANKWVAENGEWHAYAIQDLLNSSDSMAAMFEYRKGVVVVELSPLENMRHREMGIAYYGGTNSAIHRYHKGVNGWTSSGSNNPRFDGFLTEERHVGRVVYVALYGEPNPEFAN